MNRPLDPANTDSLALSLRITRPLAAALDAELERFAAANPGVSASRATIARIALMRAFLPTGATLASASAPLPVAAVAPAVPALERFPRVVTAGESTAAHKSLHARYTDARDRFRVTHDDATRALAAAGMRVENLRREMAKPSAKWTPGHAAALAAWLDTLETNGAPAPSKPATTPKPAGVRVETTPENDALRARYNAAVSEGRLTHRGTAERVGCSDKMLRMWASSKRRNLGQPLLSKIRRELKAHDAQTPPA